jgi:4'-phosphopantetheinyl transferase
MKMPADNQVLLWVTPVDASYSTELLQRFAALLDPVETGRWQRFMQAQDRQRFLLARGMVRSLLAALLGESDPASLRFTHNAHGKPALAATPGKTPPLQFNLSHTDGMLVLAVSKSMALGVDVESIERKVDLLALSARYFSACEHAELEELQAPEQRERFLVLWTLKEAWLKARGLGLHIPLDDFSFSFGGKGPEISFGPQLAEEPGDWQFRLLRQDKFRIALAVQCSAGVLLQVNMQRWAPAALQ